MFNKILTNISKKANIIFVISLLFLTILGFQKGLQNKGIIEGFDAVDNLYPNRFFGWEVIREGDMSFWNPYLFCGYPHLASPISDIFYPIDWMFYFSVKPIIWNLNIMLHIFLLGLFTYLFVKELGLSSTASALTAFVLAFSEYNIWHLVIGASNVMRVLVWLPLLLLIITKICRRVTGSRIALGSLTVALMLVAGFLQTAYYFLMLAVLYAAFLLIFVVNARRRLIVIGSLFLIIIGGLGLCAVQFLPTLELLRQTTRAVGAFTFEIATIASLPPYYIIRTLIPDFFGPVFECIPMQIHEKLGVFPIQCPFYMGILPAVFLIYIIWVKRRDRKILFWLVSYLLFFLISLGAWLKPFYWIAYKIIPGYQNFLGPSRHTVVVLFCQAMLVGYGFDYLLRSSRRQKAYKLAWILTICLVVYFVFAYLVRGVVFDSVQKSTILTPSMKTSIVTLYKVMLHSFWGPFFLLICTGLLLFLLRRYSRFKNFIIAFILIIIIMDLFSHTIPLLSNNMLNYSGHEDMVLIKQKAKSGNQPWRLHLVDNVYLPSSFHRRNGIAITQKIELTGGRDPIRLSNYARFIDLIGHIPAPKSRKEPNYVMFKKIERRHLLDLLNVRFVIFGDLLPGIEKLGFKRLDQTDDDNCYVYENMYVMPRAFLSYVILPCKTSEEAFRLVASEDFDPKRITIIESDSSAIHHNLFNTTELNYWKNIHFEPAGIISYKNDKIRIEVDSTQPAFLVLTDVFYPGWKVYIDGIEKKLVKANYLFRAVEVDKGHHIIEFFFQPRSFKYGLIISCVTATFLVCFSLISFFVKHSS